MAEVTLDAAELQAFTTWLRSQGFKVRNAHRYEVLRVRDREGTQHSWYIDRGERKPARARKSGRLRAWWPRNKRGVPAEAWRLMREYREGLASARAG